MNSINFRPFDGTLLEEELALQQPILELQESYNIQLKLKQVCHVLLGRKPPKAGQKVDNRRYRIPEGFTETLRAMLGMFKVTDKLTWACFPEKFNDYGWRKTSYAEIRKIRSQSQTALSDDIIKRSLKVLEKMGVIERHSPWIAWRKRRSLEIRFHAHKLIEILRGLGEEAQAKNSAVLPIKVTGDSMVIYPPSSISTKVQGSSPAPGELDNKEKSLPAGKDLLSEKKVSPVLYEIWQVLKGHFAENRVLSDVQLKLLERRINDPIAKNRLTLERAKYFDQLMAFEYDKSKWYLTRDLNVFLRFWPAIQLRLMGWRVGISASFDHASLKTLTKDTVLANFKEKVAILCSEFIYALQMSKKIWNPEDTLFNCYAHRIDDDPLAILEVALIFGLHMPMVYARLNSTVFTKLKERALYYLRLAESLPIFSFVRLNSLEFLELFSVAQNQYKHLIRGDALYYRYPCC